MLSQNISLAALCSLLSAHSATMQEPGKHQDTAADVAQEDSYPSRGGDGGGREGEGPSIRTRIPIYKTGTLITRTSNAISFVIVGPPLPKKKTTVLARVRRYIPASIEEKDFAAVVSELLGPDFIPFEDSCLKVSVTLSFQRTIMNSGDQGSLVSFVLDALKGVVYKDKGQVTALSCMKRVTPDDPSIAVSVSINDVYAGDPTQH